MGIYILLQVGHQSRNPGNYLQKQTTTTGEEISIRVVLQNVLYANYFYIPNTTTHIHLFNKIKTIRKM